MERAEHKIIGRYPKIPDHSDLRGFTYRAPSNYEWADDHENSPPQDNKDALLAVE